MKQVPADRWDVKEYLDVDRSAPGKMTTRWGGFIDHIDQFDATFFGVSPREAQLMDPQQRLALELSWEALEDAGIDPLSLRGGNVGVFVGAMWCDYARLTAEDATAIDQHTGTGIDTSIISGAGLVHARARGHELDDQHGGLERRWSRSTSRARACARVRRRWRSPAAST